MLRGAGFLGPEVLSDIQLRRGAEDDAGEQRCVGALCRVAWCSGERDKMKQADLIWWSG